MVDLEILKRREITSEELKKRLVADVTKRTGTTEEQQRVDAMLNRIRSRVQEGINRNLADWHIYYALDKAWDTPWRQFHPRLFGALEGANLDQTCDILRSLNLENLIESYTDTDKKTKYRINEENFSILVGLVRSYTTIRWAKIVNDRRLTPFFKFEAAKATTLNRTKCEVLTDRVQVMSDQYSYFDTMKQAVLHMLHYGVCHQFIREEWHWEDQLRQKDAQSWTSNPGEQSVLPGVNPDTDGEFEIVTDKEGLRYDLPHPSRCYRDLAHPAYTINSDSGCEYVGYWKIVPYRHVVANQWWNTDRVSRGVSGNVLIDGSNLYFQTAYSACKLASPVQIATQTPGSTAIQIGVGTGDMDREKSIASQWYTNDLGDQGTLVTHHFEKLVPSENGLGNYNYPVWFRFVLAGDGCTVLYCAPLPGCPDIYYGYDADENRTKPASLALEILPHQYQFENLLNQILMACKQNLANFTMVNTDVMDEEQISGLKRIGNLIYKKLNLFGVSFKKLGKLFQSTQSTSRDLGISLGLPKQNVAELVNVLKTILDVLERVLVMSSHEVAQAASHEQTREEVRNIASSTSSRLTFTATPVDIARDAWKRQLYTYLMAYGDEDFYGHIPADNEITAEQLQSLGFAYADPDGMVGKEKFRRVRAKRSKLALPLYEFAATRDGEDRTSDREMATVMATFARDLMQNPITAQAIGPDQAIEIANKIAYLAGLPRDFKIRNVGGSAEQMRAQAQEDLKRVAETVLQAADQHIAKAITPLLEEVKRQGTELAVLMRIAGVAPPHPDAQSNQTATAGG